jgi:hypothetical protein
MGKALKHFTKILNKNRNMLSLPVRSTLTDPPNANSSQNRKWRKQKHKKQPQNQTGFYTQLLRASQLQMLKM